MQTPFNLKVGDYCHAYTKGIHKVIAIEYPTKRASTALVSLESVLDSNFNIRKGHKSNCDIAWCRKVDLNKLLETHKNTYEQQLKNLKECLV